MYHHIVLCSLKKNVANKLGTHCAPKLRIIIFLQAHNKRSERKILMETPTLVRIWLDWIRQKDTQIPAGTKLESSSNLANLTNPLQDSQLACVPNWVRGSHAHRFTNQAHSEFRNMRNYCENIRSAMCCCLDSWCMYEGRVKSKNTDFFLHFW